MTGGIRTYHGRHGRLGPTAHTTLAEFLPRYGVDPEGTPLDVSGLFGRGLPVVLEIGCGKGEATIELARRQPDVGFLAADVHTSGIAAVLAACRDDGLENLLVVHGDAVVLMRQRIPSGSLAGIRAFFPDPWPKARHAKRRLIRADLVRLAASRLRPGGLLHLATDRPEYAAEMLAVLGREPLLVNCVRDYADRPAWRPLTGYERRALAAGHGVRELMFRRAAVT